ncbi:MAG: hypothetical protein IT440_14655 [Phycisphaeraceae bacterium]|nr:hypothetical protein [Phycisphaeraceae bacterium]
MLLSITGGGLDFAYVTSAESTGSTITIPASAAAGDIAILFDMATEENGTPSSTGTPTGWTSLKLATEDVDAIYPFGANWCYARASYKELSSSDPGASVSGMSGDYAIDKMMWVFRPNFVVGSLVASTWSGQATEGNPSAQTISASGQDAPLIAMAITANHGTASLFTTESPAFQQTVTKSDSDIRFGFTIYGTGTTPQNHSVDASDTGGDPADVFMSGYIRATAA